MESSPYAHLLGKMGQVRKKSNRLVRIRYRRGYHIHINGHNLTKQKLEERHNLHDT